MKKKSKKGMNRREFVGLSALGMTSLTILPSYTIGGVRIPPSDRVVIGVIGCGQQGINDFNSFTEVPGVQVAAGADVDSMKQERIKLRVKSWQESISMPQRCDAYEHYGRLLDRTDIDAVIITTPDHWHALNTIHACESGKDVYVQKPLSFTIKESLKMVDVAEHTKRVVQVGSQQRSSGEFKKAVELVQSGAIGHIEKIYSRIGPPPDPYDLPKEPVPDNLNWNLWVGPLHDDTFHYNPGLCPPISIDPEENETFWGKWRYYKETGNGFTGDWGAHMFDIAQWAIGMDGTGPVEIIPKGYNGQEYLTYKYANGIVMTEQPYLDDMPDAKGVKFIGTDGWIEVARGYLACSKSKLVPKELAGHRPRVMTPEEREAFYAGMQKDKEKGGAFEVSSPHMQDFIDCVRSRQDPIAPIQAGASTAIVCCLGNIASELGRPVKWNPVTSRFVDDAEATNHRLHHYKYRNPYKL